MISQTTSKANFTTPSLWVVHKFGGSSVANFEKMSRVSRIVQENKGQQKAVVVSAMSGVTDALLRMIDFACQGNEEYLSQHQALQLRHIKEVTLLSLPAETSAALSHIIEADFLKISEILRGVYLTRGASDATRDFVVGHGEIWSAQMVNQLFLSQNTPSIWLDAREIVVAYRNDTGICVDWELSQKNWNHWEEAHSGTPLVVITGFVAKNRDGIPTTLGRNGSDFSGSIFGKLSSASEIIIWTDVDGVMTADPRLVPDAIVLESLSYREATEMAYFGAKVLHPSTMAPAIEAQIPIWIKNTLNPSHPGTKISHTSTELGSAIRAISVIQNMALLTVEGTGMMGVPGIAQRLFGALREVGISVVLISQASSEHSICFVVAQIQAELAQQTLEKAFYAELSGKQISAIEVVIPCCVLAAVGDGMDHQPGAAARFFAALGQGGISIRAIAQGASERNISVVIDQSAAQRALRLIHSAFFLSRQTLSVGIIGVGNVGHALLRQIAHEIQRLKLEQRIDLRVRALATSKKMLLAEDEIDLTHWEQSLESAAVPMDLKSFSQHVKSSHLPHSVMIDCSADASLSPEYLRWLDQGLHIISANKKANTESIEFYRTLRRAIQKSHCQFLYETNVGAGLPILGTLRGLIQTGDQIHKIEGVLSGTLSFLFNSFDGSRPFSELVLEAKANGYTEPDPRQDLSGMDVARKVVILAREIGLEIELNDVQVEDLSVYSDSQMADFQKKAQASNQVLRYVGVIEPQSRQFKVGLQSYSRGHSFSRISGRDNIISFKTLRYEPEPLIIQGPGAGAEVTAAGVFADLLRLASSFVNSSGGFG